MFENYRKIHFIGVATFTDDRLESRQDTPHSVDGSFRVGSFLEHHILDEMKRAEPPPVPQPPAPKKPKVVEGSILTDAEDAWLRKVIREAKDHRT